MLDASALLVVLRDEPGAGRVKMTDIAKAHIVVHLCSGF